MLKKNGVLDDFREENSSVKFTGTWREWWRGLAAGGILQAALSFIIVTAMSLEWLDEIVLKLDLFGLEWEPYITLYVCAVFLAILFYLIFSKSWKQPFVRVFLLSLICTILGVLSTLGARAYENDTDFSKELFNFFQFKGELVG